MKFILDINNVKVLLDHGQLETIVNILYGCEHVEHKYMGSKSGKSEYMDIISVINVRDVLKTSAMSDTEYDALVFMTKQQASI